MPRLFTVASNETLVAMINDAKERLVIVAPGLSREVASALVDRIGKDHGPRELSVTLDVDPEVCRLGYGDVESLDLLRPALESRTRALQVQKGVRIGLVVSDSEILVYSPTPQLIEAGSTSEEKPNALRIAGFGPHEFSLACGAGDEQVLGAGQEVGLHFADKATVEQTKADLKENPPRRFDLVRLERVFNYKLEFVDFSMENYRLNTRSVPLSADLLGLAEENLQDRLRNTFRVFQNGSPFEFEIPDPSNQEHNLKVTEKALQEEADRLRKDYLISLGSSSYGSLILKRERPEFEAKVERLRAMVQEYANCVRKDIAKAINATRQDLLNALWPRIKDAPPKPWLKRSVDGQLSVDALRMRLEGEVDKAFGKVEESFDPKVVCLFKGVTYQTITSDEHFRSAVEKFFGKEEAEKLFSEYEASPVKDEFPK
ncbi:MAG: hypothetical protein ACOYMN_20655 [Roseimicrobium sp.]|jgi:hypothetical protein